MSDSGMVNAEKTLTTNSRAQTNDLEWNTTFHLLNTSNVVSIEHEFTYHSWVTALQSK